MLINARRTGKEAKVSLVRMVNALMCFTHSLLLKFMMVPELRESACDCLHDIVCKGKQPLVPEHATCCVNSGPAFLISSGMDPLAKVQLVESLMQVLDRTGLLAPTEVCTQLLCLFMRSPVVHVCEHVQMYLCVCVPTDDCLFTSYH